MSKKGKSGDKKHAKRKKSTDRRPLAQKYFVAHRVNMSTPKREKSKVSGKQEKGRLSGRGNTTWFLRGDPSFTESISIIGF